MSVVKSHTCVLSVAMQMKTHLAMKMVIFYNPRMFYNCESPLRRCIIIPAINYKILIAQCSPPVGYLSCLIVSICLFWLIYVAVGFFPQYYNKSVNNLYVQQ